MTNFKCSKCRTGTLKAKVDFSFCVEFDVRAGNIVSDYDKFIRSCADAKSNVKSVRCPKCERQWVPRETTTTSLYPENSGCQ